MNIEEIEFNGKLLAYIIHGTFDITGQQFAGDTEDFLQIGVMRLPGGTKLKSHYHLPQKKLITKNQEVLIVLSGKIEVLFFDIDEKTEVGSRILKGGDIIALL
ncbi:MAG: hypothetical protein JRJ21_10825, partial [Deltaproteobacteria bacterium]|nr:hypothetical protein [Deltaproteobacteria bacterium]